MSDETAKQLIERRLLEIASEACDVIADSVRNKVVARGQQTRSADAWRVIDNIRGVDSALAGDGETDGSSPVDDLANRREALKQALRNRRSEPSR